MKRFILICAFSSGLPIAAAAEEETGKSLMEQGAELFWEGLRQEMEPTLDELLGLADQFAPAMQSFIEEMGPALAEIAAEIQDWSTYEVPEMLPNGDIIIRKKPEQAPEPLPEAPDPDLTDPVEVPDKGTDI